MGLGIGIPREVAGTSRTEQSASAKPPSVSDQSQQPSSPVNMEWSQREVRKKFIILESQVQAIRKFILDIDLPIANPEEVFAYYYRHVINAWLSDAENLDQNDPELADACGDSRSAFTCAAKLKKTDTEFKENYEKLTNSLLPKLQKICSQKLVFA